VAEDWFRSRDWRPDEFERRLARARPSNRPQYLRIQALTLLESGRADDRRAAIELLERLMSLPDPELEANTAPEHLGTAYAADGDFERAANLFAEATRRQTERPNVLGLAPFRLADLVLRERLAARYQSTLDLLVRDDFPWGGMNWHRFERAKSIAFLSHRLRYFDQARAAASEALRLATSETRPEFPRHPTVGLVETDVGTLQELKQVASPRT